MIARLPSIRSSTDSETRLGGFTMLELLVVIAIMGLALTFVIPNLIGELHKQRKQAYLGEVTTFMVAAKQEALRRGVPVVIEIDATGNRLFAFANVDEDAALAYAPDNSVAPRTADYEVSHLDLPSSGNAFLMDFWGPGDGAPRGANSTDGLTLNSDGDRVIVFEPNGSVRDIGAIRFSDLSARNSFEVRVAPAATGRIQLRKYNDSSDFGGPNYLLRGIDDSTNLNYWKWY